MAKISGLFETRRQAETAVERLVQEFHVKADDITIAAAGAENTAGEKPAGADSGGGARAQAPRQDAALHGQVEVAVDIADEAVARHVRQAFAEFGAKAA